jgi:hypothetical protein
VWRIESSCAVCCRVGGGRGSATRIDSAGAQAGRRAFSSQGESEWASVEGEEASEGVV